LHLTYTFRFSKESQVKIANDILYYLKNEDEDKLIKPARKDEVNENDIKDTCIICRTNAQLIEIFSENTNKIKPVRDPKVFFSTIRKIFERKIRTPEYCREFEDYLLALEDLGEKTEDGELLSSVSLIKRFDCDERLFIELYRQANANYKSKDNFSCFITTAHTSKGLEWDKVIIAEDFKTIEDLLGIIEIKDEDKIQKYVSFNDNGKMFVKVPAGELRNFFGKIRSNVIKEELNLLYVAVTRAKKVLSIPSQYHIYNDRVYSAII
jgi:superfamily I DNA/RNA helicase